MPSLEIRSLSKTFGSVCVLDDVSLQVEAGEIHALVGQNGSGKSTLIKVLSGYHSPDPGSSVKVWGSELELGSAVAAHRCGLRFVHQDLGLVNDLSVVDNLMMSRTYPRRFPRRIGWREARRLTRELLARVSLDVDVSQPVGGLSYAARTSLAVARVLPDPGEGKVVLVLDEPSAALPVADVGQLMETLRQVRDAQHAIVLVSHHIEEILDVADSVSVLRDGRLVHSGPRSETDAIKLTHQIVGLHLDLTGARSGAWSSGSVRLEARDLGGGNVECVDFVVRSGEIVGFAGLSGSGRETLGPLLSGQAARAGTLAIEGVAVAPSDPSSAATAGMVTVPGDRGRFGVFLGMSVRENLTMGSLGGHQQWGRVRRSSEESEVQAWIKEFGIVAPSIEAPIESLSGGNQQKVLVARAMRRNPRVLLLDDPTAGIDVGARDQVHRILERPSTSGLATVLISTDSDELARLCDRVLILRHGRIAEELRKGDGLSAEAIDAAQLNA